VWFSNNVAKKDTRDDTPKQKQSRQFSIRDVVKTSHKDEIHQLIATDTSAAVGHKDWLRLYPAALTKVVEGLNDEEKEEAQKTVREWNDNGAPRDVQRMYDSILC
jgi:hypothetical protein